MGIPFFHSVRNTLARACRRSPSSKRIGEVHRPASRNNENEVEAEIEILISLMPPEPKICGAMHPVPSLMRDRCLAIFNRCAAFDFDEYDAPPPLGDKIDFTKMRFKAVREDAVAFGH